MVNAGYAIVGLPLLGFVVNLIWGRRLGEPNAGWVGTAAAAGSFVAAIIVWIHVLGLRSNYRVADLHIFSWFPVAGLQVNVALLVDPLSVTMALFVTGVSTAIHLYSIGYMHRDPGFDRFFIYLNLFLFSMLVLVMANNFLFNFLGWEGVGFCSYGLVGFWFQREIAAVAAKKAFVTNRVGDVGFLLAMLFIFFHFSSLNYSTVLGTLVNGHATGLLAARPGAIPATTATVITLLLFMGAVGKSAQIPLYIWLPDAMEGPTPISALIHAATMVTAGVYLMARVAPMLHYAPSTSLVIACVGAGTAFLSATIACAQDDIKKTLAYSTISQLGYMFLAVGAGDYVAGIFHMLSHAFFKALLFLAAGAVIHAVADNQDMKRMGGLGKYMPLTAITFGIAWLAISGIPPFTGFWSKDSVLEGAFQYNKVLWAIGVLTAGLTAYYMSRQFSLVFRGQARWEEARPAPVSASAAGEHAPGSTGLDAGDEQVAGHTGAAAGTSGTEEGSPGLPAPTHRGLRPRDASWLMSAPLVVLAIATVFGGGIDFPAWNFDFLTRFLAPVFPTAEVITISTAGKWVLSLVTLAICLIGLGLGLRIWVTAEHPGLEPNFLRRAWHFDDIVSATVSGPLMRVATALAVVMDNEMIDGFVNALAHGLGASGRLLRKVQDGYLRTYLLGFGVGVVIILAYLSFRIAV
jgi:NADH-quinone oxidoreductase subunit L